MADPRILATFPLPPISLFPGTNNPQRSKSQHLQRAIRRSRDDRRLIHVQIHAVRQMVHDCVAVDLRGLAPIEDGQSFLVVRRHCQQSQGGRVVDISARHRGGRHRFPQRILANAVP